MGCFGEQLIVVGRIELSPWPPLPGGIAKSLEAERNPVPSNGSGSKALAQSSHGGHLGNPGGWTLASAFISSLWFPQSGARPMRRQVGRES